MVYLRQFASLPAGFLNTTDDVVQDTAYLDLAANVEVAWGLFVARTTKIGDVFRCILPTATTDTIYGAILKDESIYHDYYQTDNTYKGTQLIPVLREAQGYYALSSVAITAVNDPVYVETAAGANRGKLKNNNTGSTGILLPRAKWLETTASAGKVLIEFDTSN
jgi:hypothetical protein